MSDTGRNRNSEYRSGSGNRESRNRSREYRENNYRRSESRERGRSSSGNREDRSREYRGSGNRDRARSSSGSRENRNRDSRSRENRNREYVGYESYGREQVRRGSQDTVRRKSGRDAYDRQRTQRHKSERDEYSRAGREHRRHGSEIDEYRRLDNRSRKRRQDEYYGHESRRRRSRKEEKARRDTMRMVFFLGCVFLILTVAIIVKETRGNKSKVKEAEEQGPTFDYEAAVRGMTLYDANEHTISEERAEELMQDYAACYGFDVSAYSEPVRLLLMNHFEARDFALNYPLHVDKGTATDADAIEISPSVYVGEDVSGDGSAERDLSDIDLSAGIPSLYQWDTRWAYHIYGSDAMGITGCGPTALSMVTMYLLQDKKYTPDWMAEFATNEGYMVAGNGTSWDLMYDGAVKLGLNVSILALDENQIAGAVMNGMPVICIMGPGDFTTEGHFIVITGYEGELIDGLYQNGRFIVNDPNCKEKSKLKWDFGRLVNQIGNVWAYSAPEKPEEPAADSDSFDEGSENTGAEAGDSM